VTDSKQLITLHPPEKYAEEALAKESWSEISKLLEVESYLQQLKITVSEVTPKPAPPTQQTSTNPVTPFTQSQSAEKIALTHEQYWSHKAMSLADVAGQQTELLKQLQARLPPVNQQASVQVTPTTITGVSVQQGAYAPTPQAQAATLLVEHKTWLDIGYDIQGLEEQRRYIMETLAAELEVEGPVLPPHILR